MISTTNFIGSDGVDLGSKLLEKEYFNGVYLNIANQYITPELWCWGQNGAGQLPTNEGIVSSKSTPVTSFAGGANWKQISNGENHGAAIKTDGTLWVWGVLNNSYFQLGTNDIINRLTPVTTFGGGTNWKQVSCGGWFTAAIKTDGTLWTWGSNYNGTLGLNALTVVCTPVTTFAGGTNWKQVSCKNALALAIKNDGTLWGWGENGYGQLGIGIVNTSRSTPVTTFAGGNDWKQVSCGGVVSAAIKTDGSLWTWGRNQYGQLGTNDVSNRSTPVTTFAGGNDWKQVSCSVYHIAAIKTDGSLWTWGYGTSGAKGDNTVTSKSTPVTTFAGGTNWKEVTCNSQATYAIKTDGTLWVWGNNFNSALGINAGNVTKRTPVTTFAGGNTWRKVSTNVNSAVLAIRSYED